MKKLSPIIPPQVHEKIIQYVQRRTQYQVGQFNMRARMQYIDRVFQRESDWSAAQERARAANAAGDPTKVQNTTIPVVAPQVESAANYLSEVFLSSYPLFPIVGKPQLQDAALQMETVIGEHGVEFQWPAELLASIKDGLRYNVMAVEIDWQKKKTWAVSSDARKSLTEGSATPTVFQGNAIRRLSPYNLILDTAVAPHEIHTRGDFAGYTEIISRIELKRRIEELDPTNLTRIKEAFESGDATASLRTSSDSFFIPQVNPQAMVVSSEQGSPQDWDAWAGIADNSKIQYSSFYEWTVIYARILPIDFRMEIENRSTVQIFKIITVNRKVCIQFQRQTNAHNLLPIIVASPKEEGLGWQDKSFADTSAPYQEISTALFNSGLESQRRKVYDRLLYDPTKIAKADIEKTSPVARIPIKSEHYGKPLSEAVYQIPYRDDNAPLIFDISQRVVEMANVAVGSNRVQQGQFQKGNKTRYEFQETMTNSDGRLRMMALILEARFFQPIKHIIKYNTLQYQPPVRLYNRSEKQQVDIDPVKLREAALEFRVADGYTPTSKLLGFDTFETFLNFAAQSPQLQQSYDVMGIVAYWLKLRGASWLEDFRIQQPPGAPTP